MHAEITFKIPLWDILEERIEGAIRGGYNRAHKHCDTPSEQAIVEEIQRSVMSAFCDLFQDKAE